jgi:hypothetical protein
VGDITPADGIPEIEKNRRETSAIDYITQRLLIKVHGGALSVSDEVREIWQEFED